MQIAKILSYLLHPLLIPVYTLMIIFNLDFYTAVLLTSSAKTSLLIMMLISTVVLPVISIVILKRTGFISSLHIDLRKERTLPYILTAGFYYISFQSLNALSLPSLISLLLLGALITVLLTLVVNLFWKISAHMTGAGGLSGLFAGLSVIYGIDLLYLIISLVFVSGCIAWSRLKLNTHNPLQVIAGYLLGAGVMFALLIITR